MIRTTIFWVHLACGIAAGLVILMMSVTGVILTYERQILDFAGPRVAIPDDGRRLPLDDLLASVALAEPDFEAGTIAVPIDADDPITVSAGRGNSRLVDPYTGAMIPSGEGRLGEFFGAVTGWHRWFNAPRESRGPWRAITGASNLIFLFLILSGLYLWLPKIFKWAMFRARLVFMPAADSKARDFNWHHVFGIWTAVPLAVVVATASVFYYPWANDLVYRSFGEEPPGRGGPGGGGGATLLALAEPPAADAGPLLSVDELFGFAAEYTEDWQTISLPAAVPAEGPVRVSIDLGNGGQPQLRHTLLLDARSGTALDWQPFQSQSPGRRARSWVRFLHTGEALGIVGQTVAGLVSLTSVLMVWTGFALAWRRLIVPLLGRPSA